MNGVKAFFDTSVLLYMYSGVDPTKQARAKELFRRFARSSRFLVSTQVVQEFYAAGSRKLGLPHAELREATEALMELPLVTVAPAHIRSAIRLEEQHMISFWDALILAAAESGGANVLYTEDLNDGQRYGAVTVRNPFQASEV